MKKTTSLVTVLALGLATVSLAAEGTWTQKTDMLTARYGCGAGEVDGKIYVIGGWDAWNDPTPLATVEVYDPATDTWEGKADMPTARGTLATAVLDGKIYAMGGSLGGSSYSTVEVYDPNPLVVDFNGDGIVDCADICMMTELTRPGRSLMSQTVVTDGQWHRIGLVWDGLYRTLYVDGAAVAEDTQNALTSSSNGLYIGTGKAMQPGTFFSGLIDDVRIYDRAVTPK